jgi:hypothetical protein
MRSQNDGIQDREMREHLCPDGRIVFPDTAGKNANVEFPFQ